MKVILLKGVQKLGSKLDIVNVSDGFAMNSLFPQKLAELATPAAMKRVEKLRTAEEAQKKVNEDLLIKNLKGLEGITIELTGKANEKGSLFAGIHKDELISAIKEASKIDVSSDYIVLDKPLKEVGEHKVTVKVQDKSVQITVNIKSSE